MPFVVARKNEFVGIEDPSTFFYSAERKKIILNKLEGIQLKEGEAMGFFRKGDTVSLWRRSGREWKSGEIEIIACERSPGHALVRALRVAFSPPPLLAPSSRPHTVGRALATGVIEAMYPTHDQEIVNALRRDWVRAFWRPQPLSMIRAYFGEKVALYFSFLGRPPQKRKATAMLASPLRLPSLPTIPLIGGRM